MRLALLLAALFVLLPAAAPQLGPQEFALAGTVVNRLSGAPVRNARVWLSSGEQVESDTTGAFSFAHLVAGQYGVAAFKAGFEEGEPVAVDLSASRADLAIRLTPLASIVGKIADADGEPVAGVVVVAMRSQIVEGWRRGVPAGQAITDDRGQYRIPWLPAGRYLVQAAGYDEHTFAGEPEAALKSSDAFAPVYFGDSRDRALAPLLTLAPGAEAHADISIALRTGHRIRGRLVGLKPYTQPVLKLLSGDEDLGLNRSSVNFATGHFEIRNVFDGAYRLRVTGVGADDRPLGGEQEIQVAGRDVEDVSLALGPGFVIKGTVRIGGPTEPADKESIQQALDEFFLGLASPDGPTLNSEPAVDGAFRIPSAIPGKYRVGFLLPAPLYVSSARSGDTDLLADPQLVLRSSPPADIEVVLRADGGSIEGTLAPEIMRDGPVCVLLVPESLRRPPEAACTGDGSFDFGGVAPGSYRLHAWNGKAEVEYNAPQVLRTLAGSGTRVDVQPSASAEIQLKTLSEVPQ
jgi:hypothetical protein